MLERFIKLADKVSLILLRYTSVQMLTGSELAAATEGRDLLQPVAHTITELEGETVSLSGKVIPMLKNMKRSIDSMSPTTEPVRQLKTMCQAQYERKFKDIEFVDTFSIATLLDPRFKTLYLCPLAHAKVLKNVSDMVQIANKDSMTNPNEISSFAPKPGSNNLWNFHRQMVHESSLNHEPDTPGGISGELRNFLHQKVVSLDSNPLAIWESIRSEYPTLYPIAREYLSKMVTSVRSERLFSRTGATTKNRYRLNAKRMARLAFMGSLSANFWASC
ncbi:zinc finger BED domain-containing protein 4-like [Wyeomyia smithii]|uniref:zinc finger BED domain-containing protein 4-like n=1 Tax=Wyeomyia smithii TaxID=174621 RepID=UPI0024681614|nr:zinc finger BED domain-containing protein 4-like [Wyeomyia smithii]